MRRQFIGMVTSVCFVIITGCAGIIENLPTPPDVLVNVTFDGPYDADIPDDFLKKIKAASVVSASSVPDLWVGVGMHFELRGDDIRSLHFYDRAIEQYRKRHEPSGEATAVTRKVILLSRSGRYPDALREMEKEQAETSGGGVKAFTDYRRGQYHLYLGEPGRAVAYLRQSLSHLEAAEKNDYVMMLKRDAALALGIALLTEGFFPSLMKSSPASVSPEALSPDIYLREIRFHLNQALTLNERLRKVNLGHSFPDAIFHVMSVRTRNHLALCDALEGKYDDAAAGFNVAFDEAHGNGLIAGRLENLFLSAVSHLPEKSPKGGIEAAKRLIDLADHYHLPIDGIRGRYVLSRYETDRGDFKAAADLLTSAIALMESRVDLKAMDALMKANSFDSRVLYDDLIDLHVRLGNTTAALETAERAKSRMLVSTIAGKDIGKTAEESLWIGRMRDASEKILAGYRTMNAMTMDEKSFSESIRDLTTAQTTYDDLLFVIKTHNEELYSLLRVESPDLEEIRHLMDGNTTLFCYYMADSFFYVWAVNKAHVRMIRVVRKKEEITGLVFALQRAIRRRDKKQTDILSGKAYDFLLKPVIGFVSGDRIGFVPHDVLHYLPFAAMSYRGASLTEGFAVFDLPHAGVLKYALKKQYSQGIRILVWADKKSDLPFVQEETQAVRKSFPRTDILLAGDATKSIVDKTVAEYDYIHFAARAVMNPREPLASGFPASLAGGGLTIRLEDIFRWQFQGSGVVVSASQSEGPVTDGSDIVLFNRAFLYAGSPGLIKSLWRVDSRARVIFMDLLYKNLEKTGSMADALRGAQSEMSQIGFAPFDWAGYTLTGPF
ncbi:MAG: CHAT domain-containing tetratricopeptide repeat protein [Smithellaceae bacterium]